MEPSQFYQSVHQHSLWKSSSPPSLSFCRDKSSDACSTQSFMLQNKQKGGRDHARSIFPSPPSRKIGKFKFNVKNLIQESRMKQYTKMIKKKIEDLSSKPKSILYTPHNKFKHISEQRKPISFRTEEESEALIKKSSKIPINFVRFGNKMWKINRPNLKSKLIQQKTEALSPEPRPSTFFSLKDKTRKAISPKVSNFAPKYSFSVDSSACETESSICSDIEIQEELLKKRSNMAKKRCAKKSLFCNSPPIPKEFRNDIINKVIKNILVKKSKLSVPEKEAKMPINVQKELSLGYIHKQKLKRTTINNLTSLSLIGRNIGKSQDPSAVEVIPLSPQSKCRKRRPRNTLNDQIVHLWKSS
ncbi:unnamed protein product [Moneuplotes crassus]|uniref:Uncharacterized protein n=1 Tax=Euplotes crassus TaxID=5936 RepID=A0AAD1Y8F6_EUPCR|nr:unnamed protein product [Moneuplotes crassus]